MPTRSSRKIFDPFFTTKEVGKGTGLGLTVAYAIVQEHGGRIRLESHPSAGASFYVELPVTGQAPADRRCRCGRLDGQPESDRRARRFSSSKTKTKLANAVVDALRDAGYVVEHAADGEEALERIKSNTAQPFDLVICDLKMPQVDGKTFYRQLSAAARPSRAG